MLDAPPHVVAEVLSGTLHTHPRPAMPHARTLEAFELREGHWVLLATPADAAPVSQPPFDAITLPLDAL